MKQIPKLSNIIVLFLLCFSCSPKLNDKEKANKLLADVRQIAMQKQMSVEDFKLKLQRIKKSKDDFPSSRNEIKEDVIEILTFMESEIQNNNKVIDKYKELSNFNLAKPEADCLEVEIKLTSKYVENHEIGINRYKLFINEEIRDKETLTSQLSALKEKSDDLDKEVNLLRQQEIYKCAGKK